MMMYYQPKFACQGINSSEIIVLKKSYSDHCDLDLEDSHTQKKFCMTLWVMILHNHTRFGNKCFVVLKVSSRQTLTNILNLHCDLDLERCNPIFPQNTQAYDAVLSNQGKLQMDLQLMRYRENSHILIT